MFNVILGILHFNYAHYALNLTKPCIQKTVDFITFFVISAWYAWFV